MYIIRPVFSVSIFVNACLHNHFIISALFFCKPFVCMVDYYKKIKHVFYMIIITQKNFLVLQALVNNLGYEFSVSLESMRVFLHKTSPTILFHLKALERSGLISIERSAGAVSKIFIDKNKYLFLLNERKV